jgi:four helix bundle protein
VPRQVDAGHAREAGDRQEEADESLYWMELLVELGVVTEGRVGDLMREMDEIVAMTVASIKTLRAKHKPSSRDNS